VDFTPADQQSAAARAPDDGAHERVTGTNRLSGVGSDRGRTDRGNVNMPMMKHERPAHPLFVISRAEILVRKERLVGGFDDDVGVV